MRKLIERLFSELTATTNEQPLPQASLHLATAALLVEVISIDQQFDDREWQQLHTLLKVQCQLSSAEVDELIAEARQASNDSTSLYDFTQLINQHCDYAEKLKLMENLWQVAFADEHLDKYEEHIIRRIADLIYVSHRDFIQAKRTVKGLT